MDVFIFILCRSLLEDLILHSLLIRPFPRMWGRGVGGGLIHYCGTVVTELLPTFKEEYNLSHTLEAERIPMDCPAMPPHGHAGLGSVEMWF